MTITQRRPADAGRSDPAPIPLRRRFVRGTLFWLFGLSASVLIGSLWGSSVTGSRSTVQGAASEVAHTEIVQDRLLGWAAEGLATVEAAVSHEVALVDRLVELPETEQVLAALTDQVVDAAFAPIGATATVDPALALQPAIPQITRALVAEGVQVDEPTVAGLIARLEPIVVDGEGGLPVTSAATRASRTLSLAAAAAAAAMLAFGAGAVAASPDRIAAVRTLAYRLTLTGLSLAVMLRLGAWIADPNGGATPWWSGVSHLLGSHTHVPLIIAAVGATIGGVAMLMRRNRTRPAP